MGTFTRSAVAGGGYFRTLHQKTGGGREVRALRTCVSEVYRQRAEGDKEEPAYFFPRGHEVLVGFEDVRQSLLDVFLLHAGQHGGGQEQ